MDFILPAVPTTGYYVTDRDIYSAANSCTIQDNRKVFCISPGKLILRPGFRVQAGGYFASLKNVNNVPVDVDLDKDGMPDRWELLNFNARLTERPSDDYDGDGAPDYVEYKFGSDPNNSTSKPAGKGTYYEYDEMGRIKTVFRLR